MAIETIHLTGTFHLPTSEYILQTLIPSVVHPSAYHLRTFHTSLIIKVVVRHYVIVIPWVVRLYMEVVESCYR